jgi:hypothetical protein
VAAHSASEKVPVSLLEQALGYLRLGLPVFPVCGTTSHSHLAADGKPQLCSDPGKVALVKWKAYQDRLPTEDELRRWWRRYPDANIAMATGHLSMKCTIGRGPIEFCQFCQSIFFGNGSRSGAEVEACPTIGTRRGPTCRLELVG